MDLMPTPTMVLMEEREVMATTMEEKEAMIQTPQDQEAGGQVSLTPTLIHLEDPAAEREASSSQEVEELCP